MKTESRLLCGVKPDLREVAALQQAMISQAATSCRTWDPFQQAEVRKALACRRSEDLYATPSARRLAD